MSQLAIRDVLTTQLATLGIDTAYENSGFNPEGKSEFLAAYYNPSLSDSCGKTSASSDNESGSFLVSVFILTNATTFDNRQLEIIGLVKSKFYNSLQLSNVQINEVTISPTPVIDGAHYRRDVNINYSSFQSRI